MQKKYIDLILKEALKAEKRGEVPVGCVIVKNGKIISKAHNLVETKQNTLYHAEMIAISKATKKIKNWQSDPYDWATDYVYGVEKDYRLVKVGKVGCYLHGDGLANVILSDGLGNFVNTKDYKGKLHKQNNIFITCYGNGLAAC